MFRYSDGTFRQSLPSFILEGDTKVSTKNWTMDQWNIKGYNEAIKLIRKPFYSYTMQWVKDGIVYREEAITTEFDLEAAKADKLEKIQQGKVAARDGGFDVSGTKFDSDQSARIAYLELSMKLQTDSTFTTEWKANDETWVMMDAALYAQVAAAGQTHIENVFAWQAQQNALVASATTAEDLAAISTVYGS